MLSCSNPLHAACRCYKQGSLSDECDFTTGACDCKENYRGDKCATCEWLPTTSLGYIPEQSSPLLTTIVPTSPLSPNSNEDVRSSNRDLIAVYFQDGFYGRRDGCKPCDCVRENTLYYDDRCDSVTGTKRSTWLDPDLPGPPPRYNPDLPEYRSSLQFTRSTWSDPDLPGPDIGCLQYYSLRSHTPVNRGLTL
eukprot:sb/3471039/